MGPSMIGIMEPLGSGDFRVSEGHIISVLGPPFQGVFLVIVVGV